MTERKDTQPSLPTGPLLLKGVIVDPSPLKTPPFRAEGTGEASGITDFNVRATVLVRDPVTGESVRLDDILCKQPGSGIPAPIVSNTPCNLRVPSYDELSRRITTNMEAYPAETPPVVQNQAIPVKVKSTMDSYASRPSWMCQRMAQWERDAKKQLGLISDRDDITMLQGRKNGRSPGVLIHQDNGEIWVFDNSGKQYVVMDGTQVGIQASSFDTGNAKREHSSIAIGGLPAEDNPVADVLPQGPVVSPHPKTIPSITKIMNTITPILDMITLVEVCVEAVNTVMQ